MEWAARAHSAALMMVCLNLLELVVISPAANIPAADVACVASTLIYPSESFSRL